MKFIVVFPVSQTNSLNKIQAFELSTLVIYLLSIFDLSEEASQLKQNKQSCSAANFTSAGTAFCSSMLFKPFSSVVLQREEMQFHDVRQFFAACQQRMHSKVVYNMYRLMFPSKPHANYTCPLVA